MRTCARKLIALLLAVCLLAGVLPVALASDAPAASPIELEITALQKDGGIEVLYQAVTWINAAQANVIVAKFDRVEKLEKLIFTCTLTDEVTAALPSDQVLPNYYFSSTLIEKDEPVRLFIPAADPCVSNGSIVLTYKLNPKAVEELFPKLSPAELKDQLMCPMGMSLHTDARPIVPASVLSGATTLHTFATITVSNSDGSDVPVFLTPSAVLAEGAMETSIVATRSINVSLKQDSEPFMVGYPDDTFKPDGDITRAEVAQVLYRLLDAPAKKAAASFPDVDPDAWYADAVNELASLGYLKGDAKGNFRPNAPITRAEMAALLVRFADAAGADADVADFVDVPATHWACDAIRQAASFGWVNGVGGGRYEPDRPITRAEAAKLFCVALGRNPDKVAVAMGMGRSFADVSADHWAYPYIVDVSTARESVKFGSFEIWTAAK